MLADLLALTLFTGTPILLAVFGEVLLQRSGLLNIGLEGMMLVAALAAAAVSVLASSSSSGVVGGVVGAVAVGLLFGTAVIELRCDPILAGTAVNLAALGLTGFGYRELQARGVSVVSVPLIERVSGATTGFAKVAAAFDPVVTFAWIIAPPLLAFFLWRTRPGLRLRACGENPTAVSLSGISVRRYRWIALIVESVLAGIAGAHLSLALSPGFAENMVAGRGFVALAIVIFSRWTFAGAAAGTLLFAFTTAGQYALQSSYGGVSFHLLLALPYFVTLLLLAGFAGRVAPPAAIGTSAEPQ